jgi:hypothetical protein
MLPLADSPNGIVDLVPGDEPSLVRHGMSVA